MVTHNQPQMLPAQPGQPAGYQYSNYQEHYAGQTAPALQQFGLSDIFRVIERYRLQILVIMLVITSGTLAWQLFSPTLYQSSTNIQVELIDDVGANQADVMTRNVQRIANEVKLHRSRSAAERVVRDMKLYENKAFLKQVGGMKDLSEKEKIRKAASAVLDMVSVESEEGSDLIELKVTARSPELAAAIANQYPASVRALKNTKQAQRRKELLASLLDEQDKRAEEATMAATKLADFQRENQMLIGAGGAEDLQQVNRIAAEAASAAAMRAGSAAQSAGVSRAAQMSSTADATSPALQQLQRQEAELAAETARLSQTYGAGYPDLVRLNGELAEVRRKMATEQISARATAASVAAANNARMVELSRSEAAREAARAAQLQSALSNMTSKAYLNTKNRVEFDQLSREADLAAKAYSDIAERVGQVRAQMQIEGVTSSVVSPAVANFDPIAPSPLKYTSLAFLGSFILGLLLAFTRDMLDDRLRTVAQIRRYFQLPTFGMLPMINDGISPNLQESPVLLNPQSLFAEVARATYTEVEVLGKGVSGQSVLVTSPLPGDGKSVVSLTLAAAAVALGKRAVVLDLDLRKAGLLQQIQREMNAPDLLDVLKGKVELQKITGPAAATQEIDVEAGDTIDESVASSRIMLLSVSKPVAEPAALLNSHRMQMLLNDLKSKFDFVVVNAPATLAVRDARTMCEFTDDTLLVARWGHTTIDQMKATLEMLGHSRVAGVIFDQVDYAEHARRRYGDSIQFYFESSDYYTGGGVPSRMTFFKQLGRLFTRRRNPIA